MTIEELKEKVYTEFTDFMDKLQVIERSMKKLESDLEATLLKASSELEFQKKESKRIENLSKQADLKKEESEQNHKNSQNKLDESSKILANAKLAEESIRKRGELITIQENAANEHEQTANRKLAWAEMEERRLKFLEHKLNVIMEDAKIRKQLEELK